MPNHIIKRCDECGSAFFSASSPMQQLCPECAHQLYGYPPCVHVFKNQSCEKCGWNGARSSYMRNLLAEDPNTNNINQ